MYQRIQGRAVRTETPGFRVIQAKRSMQGKALAYVDGVPQTVVIGAVQRGGGGSSPIAPQQVNPPIASKRKNVYRYSTGSDNK